MAAPTFIQAGAGFTDAGGAWSHTGMSNATIGNLIIFQVVQDGATAGAVTLASAGQIANLAGVANSLTALAVDQPIGSPTSALQSIYIGRATASSPNIFGNNSTSDDVYVRAYEFANVNAGTTLASVIENGTAGAIANGVGTGTTVSDTGVTTLGADRLACNFVGLNDDVAIDAFVGETGGDWIEAVAEYAESSGTDACLQLQYGYTGGASVILPTGAAGAVIGNAAGFVRRAAKFTAPASGTIASVAVNLYAFGTPSDDLVIEIHTDASGLPSNTVVGSSVTVDITSTTEAVYTAPVGAAVTSGVAYWVVCRRTGAADASNYYAWPGSGTGASGVSAAGSTVGWSATTTIFNYRILVGAQPAGTINGGTDTIITAGWGVIGFALIGTTPSGTPISGTDSGSGTDSASIGILVNERAKFTDDFNRANENPIKLPWSDTSQLISNAVQGLVDYGGAALDFWATDVEISGSWISGGTRYYGLQARKTGIAGQNVELQVVKDSQNVKIFEDGVQLGIAVAATVNFGDTFILEIIGSTAKGYRIPSGGGTRTEIISRTLTTRLGPGSVGFYQREVAQVFDNFSFTNLASVTTETAALTVTVVGTDRSAPTAFSTTPVLDNFNRADESPLVGGWGSVSNLAVLSNQLAPLATSAVYAFWNTAMVERDVEAYLEIATKPVTGADSAVFARYTWTDTSGYRVRHVVASGTDTIVLERTLGNVLLGSWALELAAGDAIGIRCVGNVIEAWARVSGVWQLLGSVTDSTVAGTAPNTSLVFQHFPNASTVARWDNFGGGVLPSAVVENATVSVPTTPISGTDAGTGTDTGLVTVPISVTDLGSGTDVISVFTRALPESGAGVDASILKAAILSQDAGRGVPGAFTPILDNFNRADENPLASGWQQWGSDSQLKVVSNQVAGNVAGTSHSIWTTAQTQNVEAYVEIPTTGDWVGIYARYDPSAGGGYSAFFHPVDGWALERSSPYAMLATEAAPVVSAGDAFGIRCVGSVIQIWIRKSGVWQQIGSVVDATHDGTGTKNKLILEIWGTAARLDNFGGGTATNASENGNVTVPVSASDSGTGSDASAINRQLADSGVGSDSISALRYSLFDTGAGTETSISSARHTLTDTGAGVDTAVVTVPISTSDTGTGTDTATLVARYTLSDTGAGTDASIRTAALSSLDSGAATEVSKIGITLSDSGVGIDVISTLARPVVDSGTGVDESILIAGNERIGTDSGSGVDNATVVAVVSSSDTGAGTENQRISLTFADTGTGVEITGLARQVFDTGAGTDSATAGTLDQKVGTESGTVVESVILTVIVTGSDTGTGVDAFLRISQTLTDSGSGTDTGTLTVGYLLTDTLTGLDEGFLLIPISVSDFGTGSDESLLSIVTTLPEFHGSVLVSANGSRAEALTTRPAAKMTSVSMGNGNTLLKALEPGSELATTRSRSKMKKAN